MCHQPHRHDIFARQVCKGEGCEAAEEAAVKCFSGKAQSGAVSAEMVGFSGVRVSTTMLYASLNLKTESKSSAGKEISMSELRSRRRFAKIPLDYGWLLLSASFWVSLDPRFQKLCGLGMQVPAS